MADPVCIIGKHISIRGSISGAEDLVIEGRVEGTVKLTNHLTVESSGTVEANLEVEDLTINGVVRGDIVATRTICINAGARVEGNIRAPRIVIEDGARFRGQVEMEIDLPEDLKPSR